MRLLSRVKSDVSNIRIEERMHDHVTKLRLYARFKIYGFWRIVSFGRLGNVIAKLLRLDANRWLEAEATRHCRTRAPLSKL